MSNIDGSRDDQKEQEFYTHFDCFRRLVDNDGIMYIADKNFATIGETRSESQEEE